MNFSLKTISIFLFLMCIGGAPLLAQQNAHANHQHAKKAKHKKLTPEQRLTKQVDNFAKTHHLSAAQKTEAQAILKTYTEKIQATRKQKFDTPQARRQALQPLRQARIEALEKIMTPEQRTAWQTKRQARKTKTN